MRFSHISDKFKWSVNILFFTINDITELSYVITNYGVEVKLAEKLSKV